MQLGNFTEREAGPQGDRLTAKDNVDKPMVVLVREHRTGIKTKFNSDPNQQGYKAEGGEGVQLDIAVLATNEVFIDVLWMNGAVVDNLAGYVSQAVPIKLAWQPSVKGGNPYLTVKPLEGQELALAQQWAAANPTRFETERAQRVAQAAQFQQQTPQAAPAPVTQPPVAQPVQQYAAPTPAAVPAQQVADVNDPAVQALLAQIAGGHLPPVA